MHDDGNGRALFLAGQFAREGTGEYLLRWDGRVWTTLGGGIRSTGNYHGDGLCVYDDGSGPAMWIGGGEVWINDLNRSSSIYRWDGRSLAAPPTYPRDWIYTLASFNDGFGPALYLGGDIRIIGGEGGGWINHIVRWSPPHMGLSHSPLRAGESAQFGTTCSTPGQRVNFVYSTRGLGSYYVSQLGITLDLRHPHLAGHAIADANGHAELVRTLPPGSSGRTL